MPTELIKQQERAWLRGVAWWIPEAWPWRQQLGWVLGVERGGQFWVGYRDRTLDPTVQPEERRPPHTPWLETYVVWEESEIRQGVQSQFPATCR